MIFHSKIWLSIESNYSNHVSIYESGFRGLGLSVYGCTALSILQLHTWGHQQYSFNMVFMVLDWVYRWGVYNFVNSQSPNWGHQQNL
jgi:hypothetical protein